MQKRIELKTRAKEAQIFFLEINTIINRQVDIFSAKKYCSHRLVLTGEDIYNKDALKMI